MNLQASAKVVHAVTGPDPLTHAGDIKDEQLAIVPRRMPYADTAPSEMFATLDAGPAETVTVEVWALDEATTPSDPQQRTPVTQAARKFYLVQSGLLLTNQHLTPLAATPTGPLYIRRTADAMAASGLVRIGIV